MSNSNLLLWVLWQVLFDGQKPGYFCRIHENSNFGGKSHTFTRNDSCFTDEKWCIRSFRIFRKTICTKRTSFNDKTSSITVGRSISTGKFLLFFMIHFLNFKSFLEQEASLSYFYIGAFGISVSVLIIVGRIRQKNVEYQQLLQDV